MGVIEEAVNRIMQMEELFDEVSEAVQKEPDQISSEEMQEKVKRLSDYLSSGVWLQDYELDEQGKLPPALKRGVLAQDGIYELLGQCRK